MPYTGKKVHKNGRLPIYTESMLRRHDNPTDGIYTAINGYIYDITGKSIDSSRKRIPIRSLCVIRCLQTPVYANFHPGGFNILKEVAGKDGTELFCQYHTLGLLQRGIGADLRIGRVVPDRTPGDIKPHEIVLHDWLFDIAGKSNPYSSYSAKSAHRDQRHRLTRYTKPTQACLKILP
jgi:hypothetical protein